VTRHHADHRLSAYPLELRDDAGAVITTEDVAIMDMEVTMPFGALGDPPEDPEPPGDEWDMSEYGITEEDEEEKEWPRYQLMVCFEGYEAAMHELAAQLSPGAT
jgi:hypothetical protein